MKTLHKNKIAEIVSSEVKFDCSLKPFTSLKIGGPAEVLVTVDNEKELRTLLGYLGGEEIPWRVIGRGTNLLIGDKGVDGVILLLGTEFKKLSRFESDSTKRIMIKAGAGYSLTKLTFDCAESGLSGLEFCCGIPGALGGAVVMNAGAWGGEISDVVTGVEVTTAEGTVSLPAEQLAFSYRCSKGLVPYFGLGVVTAVELELTKDSPIMIRDRCSEIQERRKKAQQVRFPNAGSFFKNPAGNSAGKLIDISGLKGRRVGGAMVSENHANFFMNVGNATAADMLALAEIVQKSVMEKTGILLEPEVHFLGC
jgi:UDP-N-acetylmuramate dehydrogenase